MNELEQTANFQIRNAQQVHVPEDYFPISGYIVIPLYLSPDLFNEFWVRLKQQDFDQNRHAILDTYETRLPLILSNHLRLFDEQVVLPENGMELPAQEIAAFIVQATQPLINRATRGPNLPAPSKNGSTATGR